MRIAVCDDEMLFADNLKSRVESVFKKQKVEFKRYV